jgi:3',5'-cyclic AMP phosphodiesterase CpdA
MTRLTSALAALAMLAVAALGLAGPARAHEEGHALPPWQQASAWPDRIVVTFAGDPARTLAVSWRTDTSVAAAHAEIVRASPAADFDKGARRVAAATETLDLARVAHETGVHEIAVNAGLGAVTYHSVLFEGLEPDTLYAYRVGEADGEWSEWLQVRTAPTEGPMTFVYLGDAQNGILSHWARTIRAAYAKAPDARFIIHAGDLVDVASRDFEWAQWFKSVGFIHGMIPAVPVAGNHEYMSLQITPDQRKRLLSMMWRPQFRLPEEAGLPDVLRETVYRVRYGADLDVFVLDTNGEDMDVQAAWLDAQLEASTARWTVATFHHPIFSSGSDRDNPRQRGALLPVLQKHGVDLVLQGHDHTYARGTMPQTPERFAETAAGADGAVTSMFVNSVSGQKQYRFSQGGWDRYAGEGVRLDRHGEAAQFFQVIRIEGPRLAYEAWTADGQLYDGFTLAKGEDGTKRLVAGVASTMPAHGFAAAPEPAMRNE